MTLSLMMALALATRLGSADEAILLAANVGGDTDSVASIAGAILGALNPDSVNTEWYEAVERINDHGIVGIATDLANLRH